MKGRSPGRSVYRMWGVNRPSQERARPLPRVAHSTEGQSQPFSTWDMLDNSIRMVWKSSSTSKTPNHKPKPTWAELGFPTQIRCKTPCTSVLDINCCNDHLKSFEHSRMFFTQECNLLVTKCYIMPSSCCKRLFRNDNIKNNGLQKRTRVKLDS